VLFESAAQLPTQPKVKVIASVYPPIAQSARIQGMVITEAHV
jgi:hypothetical protein